MTDADAPRTGSGEAAWHSIGALEAVDLLATDPMLGLTGMAVRERLREHGPNSAAAPDAEPWWRAAIESLTEPLVLLLIGVGALYALLGELRDAITILFVILAVSAIETANEGRARRAISALRALSSPTASVVRGGAPTDVPASDLVPGDIVLLRAGSRVPADLRLLETSALRIDESGLTGESAPAAKDAAAVLSVETELGDRRNMAYAGSLVAAGKGRGTVVATGRATEVGRVARLAEAAREPRTPLQQRMRELSAWLLWLALAFSVLVPVLGVAVAGRPAQEMLLTGLSLAFATIPEELPILITIVLGIGAFRLSQQRAITRRLRAAETLGSVSALGIDKTGTLTENRMRVVRVVAGDGGWEKGEGPGEGGPAVQRLLRAAALASDAQPVAAEGGYAGDPTDVAILVAAHEHGVAASQLRADAGIVEEFPFDDTLKRMAVVCERDAERWAAVKGAPEAVISVCDRLANGGAERALTDGARAELLRAAEAMAEEGLRVIAVAERRLDPACALERNRLERDLVFLGLLGLEDPPRPEAGDAVCALRSAGVRVLMLTGDHPATARTVAARVGIPAGRVVLGREVERLSDGALRDAVADASVFARIAPEHKLRIVRALAARGEVVAVTGDGVNDAPALREAAIGVAMGRTGTDVAREAADMVLTDDNLATLVSAVREGRKLYENLRKAVRYYLAAKVALIGSSLVGVLAQLPVPFAPVQIIVMELFMDLGASTTFVAERPEEDVMARPPRAPDRPFMDGPMLAGIFAGGLSLAAAVGAAYFWAHARGMSQEAAQSAAFVAWMVGHLALAAHMRSERQPLLRLGLLSNRPYLLWAAGALGLTALGAAVPLLRETLHLAPMSAEAWLVAAGAGLVAPAWWEVLKWSRKLL